MELAICIFFAFILLSRFAFILLLFCFLPGKNKKQNKSKKTNLESNINAKKCKWTSPWFSHFFPFLTFLFSPFFVPSILLLCVLDFAILLIRFLVFPCFCFCRFFFKFSKSQNKRWSGRHNRKLGKSFHAGGMVINPLIIH